MVGRSTMPPATRHDPEDRTKTQVEDRASERKGRVLVFWEGGSAAAPLPPAGQISFGRATDCDVPIDHASVSRRHALLHVGAVIAIEDLGSSNGTRVAGQRIAPRVPMAVAPGDLVEIGGAMMLLEHPGAAAETQRPLAGQVGVHAAAAAGAIIQHESMLRVFRLLELVAPSHLSVIVLGETGVGKELAAQAVHQRSARAQRPFVRLNCAALPEALLESELFGHERGAFTGAMADREGAFERADGGTLFLDELGELPLELQPKLLRALGEQEVRRVGGKRTLRVDVRVVAATNRDLRRLVNSGHFRADLYYRLAVIQVRMPPLRDRLEDLPAVVRHLLDHIAADRGLEVHIEPDADLLAPLARHTWPGNIRELRNYLEQLVILNVRPSLGPDGVESTRAPRAASSFEDLEKLPLRTAKSELCERFERHYVQRLLEQTQGNVAEAARRAGVDRGTLFRTIRRHGLKE